MPGGFETFGLVIILNVDPRKFAVETVVLISFHLSVLIMCLIAPVKFVSAGSLIFVLHEGIHLVVRKAIPFSWMPDVSLICIVV
jgi:hypothetical protein